MSSPERPPWQVRIRRTRDTAPVGAGLLCTDCHVVTCAHVIAPTETAPTGPVFVEFQFADRHEPIPAEVIRGGWHPEKPDGSGDIAVLALHGRLPSGAEAALLREAEHVGGHRFRAYGYPQGHTDNGVWSRGTIVGSAEVEWLQLQAESSQGHPLQEGFSGAPIWDEQIGAVVGVVIAKDKVADARTGYGIPVEVIRRYWPGLEPWIGWRLAQDPAVATHWSPRSRGVERDSRPGWYFTGRRQALQELVGWLEHQPADGSVRVVTGGPGSGKSAVLARLVALADPHQRGRIEREDPTWPAHQASSPSVGRVSVAVHAAGLDLAGVSRKIADAISSTADEPSALMAQILDRGRPVVVVVDALDEAVSAAEARSIATKLLAPLARDGAAAGVKVLVGTRPGPDDSYVRVLGSRARVIDLDRKPYFELADLIEYAARSLRLDFDQTINSPYRDDPAATAQVARAIAGRAYPSFLVAGLTARARAEAPDVIDVSVPGWQQQESFPADVDVAMADYLDRLEDPQRALDLLIPVAYARHPGLPRDTLWQTLAQAYSGKPYGLADIAWLLQTAASYLLEETDEAGTRVVRLFHQALIDYLKSRTPVGLVEAAITQTLNERAHARGGWLQAESYARAHAASHAAEASAELLDELVTDAEFLLACDRSALLRALPNVRDPQARRAAQCYRVTAHRLTGDPGADAAYLELEAKIRRNYSLTEAISRLAQPQPFTTYFAHHHVGRDHLTLEGHSGPVLAISWGSLEGRPMLASAGLDGTVRLWDPPNGVQLQVLEGHRGPVLAISWGGLEGRPMLASAGGSDGTVRLWDPTDGAQLQVLEGHSGAVSAISWGGLEGRPVLASAGEDGTVRLWDPAHSDGAWSQIQGHRSQVTAVAWGNWDGRPVLASAGGSDGTVRLWDPTDGAQPQILDTFSTSMNAVAWGGLEGRPVIASAAGDGRIRLWDLADGAQEQAREGRTGQVTAVAWGSLDDRLVVASASADGKVRLWDLADGAELQTMQGHKWVRTLKWYRHTSNGQPSVVFASDDTRLWDRTDDTQRQVLPGHNWMGAVAWGSVNSRPVLAAASDHKVQVWAHPTDAVQLQVLEGHTGWVGAVAWGSLDGRPVVASASADGTVRVWDPTDAAQLQVLEDDTGPVWAIAWGSVAGRPVLASASDDCKIRLWDPTDGAQLQVLEGHTYPVWAIAWGSVAGGPVLASASDDCKVWLWDPNRQRAALIDFASPVLALDVSSDGWLALGHDEGLTVLAIRPSVFVNPQTACPWPASAPSTEPGG